MRIDLGAGKRHAIRLFGETEPAFCIEPRGSEGAILRVKRPDHSDMAGFGHDYIVALPVTGNAELDLEIFVDRGVVELFACGGLVAVTSLFFPPDPEAALSVSESSTADTENA